MVGSIVIIPLKSPSSIFEPISVKSIETLFANETAAEGSSANYAIDLDSVGPKIRTASANHNASGGIHCGVSFVDPFTGKKQSPVNAR